MKIGDVSFWYADIGLPQSRRAALAGDTSADVAIIGAGFTGLWTAYYLKKSNPALNVLVIEKEFAGFGASGRNGGWCMGTFAWNHERYARATSRAAVLDMVKALEAAVPEISRVCADEGIDADILPTEEMMLATNPAQLARMRGDIAHRQNSGDGHRIRELIAAEGQDVLSDDTIVDRLKESGIDIARRTVAKYRESLGIPSSVQRRREARVQAAR